MRIDVDQDLGSGLVNRLHPSQNANNTRLDLPGIEKFLNLKPERVSKRLFDIVVSIICILVFLPVFAFIVLAIKITSPGPLLYKHGRLGKGAKTLNIWKFRSMNWEFCTGVGHDGDAAFHQLLSENPTLAEEWEQTHKLKDDPRVSTIGRFLRRTSLDELPQFFNVLGGSLSMVGPRPIVKEEVEKYGSYALKLFTVKPGLTGLWQISGRNDTTYNQRIELDITYIEQRNLFWDFLIVLKTVKVLRGKNENGAY